MSNEICCINMHGKHDEEKIQYVQYESLSMLKLLIMSTFTLGIYQLVWFYKQWQANKIIYSRYIHPLWRALFAFFTCIELFPLINKRLSADKKSFNSSFFILLFMLSIIIPQIKDDLWYLNIVSIIPLLIIQRKINIFNKNNNILLKNEWNWINTTYILVLIALFLLYVFNLI